MVKTAHQFTGKSEKSSKRDLDMALDDEEENSPVSSGSTGSSMDNNRNYDHLVSHCFIYAEMPTITERIVNNAKTGVGEIKLVFNGISTNPLGHKSALTIWGQNAEDYGTFITANRTLPTTVFMFPDSKDLVDRSNDAFISVDASTFLQFIPGKATASQITYNGVENSWNLMTQQPNKNARELRIHPNALPSVMEWPALPHFKVGGMYLTEPKDWHVSAETTSATVEFDYTTVSPVKKFKGFK